MSAANMIAALDEEKYDVLPVGITKKGNWRICHGSVDAIREGRWEPYSVDAILSPDASRKSLLKLVGSKYKEIPVDVVIPALHGAWGEDGTVQGLLELAPDPLCGLWCPFFRRFHGKVYTKLCQGGKNPMANFLV